MEKAIGLKHRETIAKKEKGRMDGRQERGGARKEKGLQPEWKELASDFDSRFGG